MSEMITVTATEANRSFSRLLRKVKEGAHVEITSHGETIAEMRPKAAVADDSERQRRLDNWAKLRARLESQERVVIGPRTRAELYEND